VRRRSKLRADTACNGASRKYRNIVRLAELMVEQVVRSENNRQCTAEVVGKVGAKAVHPRVVTPKPPQLLADEVARKPIPARKCSSERKAIIVHPIERAQAGH